ncbi:hypothetical protein AKO1_004718 [Acrasis kona]|uniref:Uncharacterized protein n=1 Tax=Acrasis kona TaxID=1008807 RepID=A0AAW2YME6_9EUKA
MQGYVCPCCVFRPVNAGHFMGNKVPSSNDRVKYEEIIMSDPEYKEYQQSQKKRHDSMFSGDEKFITITPYSPPNKGDKTSWNIPEQQPFNVPVDYISAMVHYYNSSEEKLKIPRNCFTLFKGRTPINPGGMFSSYNIKIDEQSCKAPGYIWPSLVLVLNQEYDIKSYMESQPPAENQIKVNEQTQRIASIVENAKNVDDWKTFCTTTWNLTDAKDMGHNNQSNWKKYYEGRIKVEQQALELRASQISHSTSDTSLSTIELIRQQVIEALELKSDQPELQQRIADAVYIIDFDADTSYGSIEGAQYTCRFYSPIQGGRSIDILFNYYDKMGYSYRARYHYVAFNTLTISNNQNQSKIKPKANNCIYMDSYDSEERVPKSETRALSETESIKLQNELFGDALHFSREDFTNLLLTMSGIYSLDEAGFDSDLSARDVKKFIKKYEKPVIVYHQSKSEEEDSDDYDDYDDDDDEDDDEEDDDDDEEDDDEDDDDEEDDD